MYPNPKSSLGLERNDSLEKYNQVDLCGISSTITFLNFALCTRSMYTKNKQGNSFAVEYLWTISIYLSRKVLPQRTVLSTVSKIYKCENSCKILGKCYTITNLTMAKLGKFMSLFLFQVRNIYVPIGLEIHLLDCMSTVMDNINLLSQNLVSGIKLQFYLLESMVL